ncbi:hypothetical protein [Candidatus Thiodiazotropha sp. CDECU1]|uniref:hypothetical protein n=1 Tax=Candidatus Thiodiazotropha sp. CDECU1 TaxID=3065865 RepID=UPI0029308AE7|nr:hypothetical protein [Candidatus Thiodiazotropha sp. CDECU1]
MKRLMLLILLCHVSLLQADIAIVVPANSPINALSKKEVSNLFLSRTNRLANGKKANLIQIRDHRLRDTFYRLISSKTPTQLKSYWTMLIFSGKGKPPKSFSRKQDMFDYMKRHATAISYLESSEVTPELKVVHRFPLSD